MPPRTGERKLQILQVIAQMLQDPKGEKITTAALAKKLDVSEAALYRHFASKAQMYEGLISFIEESLFGLINKVTAEEDNGLRQLQVIINSLLGFAEKNAGMTRVLLGDALVNEEEPASACSRDDPADKLLIARPPDKVRPDRDDCKAGSVSGQRDQFGLRLRPRI